jgi:hypothetical protein
VVSVARIKWLPAETVAVLAETQKIPDATPVQHDRLEGAEMRGFHAES